MDDARLERELERRIDALGYEFVELERAGSRARPVFRLRIDVPDSEPGHGVSVDDCARVSRELEKYFDAEPEIAGRYVLEVSSPGVERPLLRRRDWERFAGREVRVQARDPVAGRGNHVEGTLLGIVDEDGPELVRLQLADGETVEIPRDEVVMARLVFRWGRD